VQNRNNKIWHCTACINLYTSLNSKLRKTAGSEQDFFSFLDSWKHFTQKAFSVLTDWWGISGHKLMYKGIHLSILWLIQVIPTCELFTWLTNVWDVLVAWFRVWMIVKLSGEASQAALWVLGSWYLWPPSCLFHSSVEPSVLSFQNMYIAVLKISSDIRNNPSGGSL